MAAYNLKELNYEVQYFKEIRLRDGSIQSKERRILELEDNLKTNKNELLAVKTDLKSVSAEKRVTMWKWKETLDFLEETLGKRTDSLYIRKKIQSLYDQIGDHYNFLVRLFSILNGEMKLDENATVGDNISFIQNNLLAFFSNNQSPCSLACQRIIAKSFAELSMLKKCVLSNVGSCVDNVNHHDPLVGLEVIIDTHVENRLLAISHIVETQKQLNCDLKQQTAILPIFHQFVREIERLLKIFDINEKDFEVRFAQIYSKLLEMSGEEIVYCKINWPE